MRRPPQNTYEEARELAWKALQPRDPMELASDGLVEWDEAGGRIKVPFLADNYLVDVGEEKVLFEHGAELYPFLSVLILHYLVGADQSPLAGDWISFREFEGGTSYFGSFTDRTLVPLKRTFGERPDLLSPAAAPLGGEPIEVGDVGVRIPVFPKVPLAVAVWRGDSEFPPEVNVLYDRTANSILRTEDLAICGALTASKLCKNAANIQETEREE